jgi:hypothetical protein
VREQGAAIRLRAKARSARLGAGQLCLLVRLSRKSALSHARSRTAVRGGLTPGSRPTSALHAATSDAAATLAERRPGRLPATGVERTRDSGRLDYIETIQQWNARIGARSARKTLLKLQVAAALADRPRLSTRFHLRRQLQQGLLRRELLDHYRLVFEKTAAEPTAHPQLSL